MKSAQMERSKQCFPSMVEEPRTNKQKLWNDIIQFLSENSCKWKNAEVSSCGSGLVHALTNALWYIDGQHDVFRKQGCPIPTPLSVFVNYNRPDLSKHRKRERGNMSSTVLKSLSSHLFTCLQGIYWNGDHWKEMKPFIEQLTKSIDDYSSYLQRSCKKVAFNQSSLSPVREISDHLSFQFLPLNRGKSVPSKLEDLFNYLNVQPELESVSVDEYSPGDPKGKYRYIQTLDLHFLLLFLLTRMGIILETLESAESSFSDSQSVIESLKKNIPIFHTRTMRKEAFSLFGRLTSSLKPSAMRYIYRSITGVCVCVWCLCMCFVLNTDL